MKKFAAYGQDGYAVMFINGEQAVAPAGLQLVELQSLPERPAGPGWKFYVPTQQWVNLFGLNDAKAAKNAEINAARLAANRTTFTFAGKAIACDELSRGDIDGANGIITLTGALPPGWPGGWKAVDNTYVAIPDVATWVSFYAAMVAQGTANFNHAQALKATLAAATTIAEVEAIKWPDNSPNHTSEGSS